MKDLIFFTDRYPYNNSEAFIENEIDIMASHFNRVFILPCGLMVDTDTCRNVPNNVKVITPPCRGDIYSKRPSNAEKKKWALKNLIPWMVACFFSKYFYTEIAYLIKTIGFSRHRFIRIFRTLAPSLRNKAYYRRKLKGEGIEEAVVYSYWLEPTILFSEKIVKTIKVQRTICRGHGWDVFSERNSDNYLAFQHQIIHYVDTMACISDDGKKYLSLKYPAETYKMGVFRLGTREYGTGVLPTNKHPFTIVTCSHLLPIKRVERVIDGVAALIKSNRGKRGVVWIHFGTGQYKDDVIAYAKSKLPENAYEFKGHVNNNELMDYYKNNSIDLFVNVSTQEGVPVSIMEAMSFGIPIVATGVGGTAEIVQHHRNGIILDANFSDKDLLTALELFYDESLDVASYRKQSRELWEQLCSSTANYEYFYKKLLAQ